MNANKEVTFTVSFKINSENADKLFDKLEEVAPYTESIDEQRCNNIRIKILAEIDPRGEPLHTLYTRCRKLAIYPKKYSSFFVDVYKLCAYGYCKLNGDIVTPTNKCKQIQLEYKMVKI